MLQIHLTLVVGGKRATPVPRHVLLVSDNPASRVPWRVVLSPGGTGRVALPPGNYTVESEDPLVFQGKAFEWRQALDVAAGNDTRLELTAENAEVGEPPAPSAASMDSASGSTFDAWDVLLRLEERVVALWTPTTHAAGVVIADTGLIATNSRVVGSASSVEVQVDPMTRVAARVLVSDAARGVAILWADPAALATHPPLTPSCDAGNFPLVERGQRVAAIVTRPGGQPSPTTGIVRAVDKGAISADFEFTIDGTGGPVLTGGGLFVGLTSPAERDEDDPRVVGVDAICEAMATATTRMKAVAAPVGAHLPAEPAVRVAESDLAAAAKKRAGGLTPYLATSSDFEVAFLTPVVAHAGLESSMEFGNWARYVATAPPVLLVRVTPKQVEGFWKTVARGAAMTQGIALPAFKSYKPGFARMRATCDGKEVVPIHPLIIERQISATAAVREGLYVFTPDALGPQCQAVMLELYSEKTPDRRDSVTIDTKLRQQIAQDFVEYRALSKDGAR